MSFPFHETTGARRGIAAIVALSGDVTKWSWIHARGVAESRHNPARMAGSKAGLKQLRRSEERSFNLVASADGSLPHRNCYLVW
jgi:hypothetical protein